MQDDPKKLDEWRWAEAKKSADRIDAEAWWELVILNYRRLVVEDVRPPETSDPLEEILGAALIKVEAFHHAGPKLTAALRSELAARGLTVGPKVRMTAGELIAAAATNGMNDPLDALYCGYTLAGGEVIENSDG